MELGVDIAREIKLRIRETTGLASICRGKLLQVSGEDRIRLAQTRRADGNPS